MSSISSGVILNTDNIQNWMVGGALFLTLISVAGSVLSFLGSNPQIHIDLFAFVWFVFSILIQKPRAWMFRWIPPILLSFFFYEVVGLGKELFIIPFELFLLRLWDLSAIDLIKGIVGWVYMAGVIFLFFVMRSGVARDFLKNEGRKSLALWLLPPLAGAVSITMVVDTWMQLNAPKPLRAAALICDKIADGRNCVPIWVPVPEKDEKGRPIPIVVAIYGRGGVSYASVRVAEDGKSL